MKLLRSIALALMLLVPVVGLSRSWEPVGLSGGGGLFTPAISPVDPQLMMINCDMSAAYISEDGGRRWRMIHQAQLRSDTGCRPAFHPVLRDTLFASSGGRICVSHDCGRTFRVVGRPPASPYGEIAIHPDHPEWMVVGLAGGGVARSSNGAAGWMRCTGPEGSLLGVCFDRTQGGVAVVVATEEGIWYSGDAGETWQRRTVGLPRGKVIAFGGASVAGSDTIMLYCSVPSEVIDGEFSGGIYRSRDRGLRWEWAMARELNTDTQRADQWAYGEVSHYRYVLTADAAPRTVYAVNTSTGFHPPHSDTVYRSDDGGETWRAVYFQDPRFSDFNVAHDFVTASTGKCFKGGEAPFGVAICNTDPERVMLVRNEPHITHDGGRSWIVGSTYPAADGEPGPGADWVCNGLVVTTTWHYDIDPHDTNRHYIAYTDLGFSRSLDGGVTWRWWNQKTWAPWRNTCYELAFDPEVPGRIWGAFSDVHDIPNDNIISGRHGHSGPGGVCVSEDFGESWKSVGEGLPGRPVTSIVLDPRSPPGRRGLYAGVFDGGVFRSDDGGEHWEPMNDGLGHPDNMRVYRVILHGDGTLFASICAKRVSRGRPLMPEGVGLYRWQVRDGRWEKINGLQPLLYLKDFEVDPRDSRRILAGAADAGDGDESGGLYFTADGGVTWRRIGRRGPQTFGGYFHPERPGWIYMTLTEGAPGAGLWLSEDNGNSWQAFDELPFANIQRVEFAAGRPDLIYLTTFGGSVWRGPATP
ncbi:MAG: WD40/YVTN/BNR-like repeat-containing protein [Limisphaerales bacterium]